MLRSVAIFVLIINEDVKLEEEVCKSNFEVNCINVVSYFIIDLIPIFVIFYLHWRNFRSKKTLPERNNNINESKKTLHLTNKSQTSEETS